MIVAFLYVLVPFIIYDNPGITARASLKISREMMKGFKLKFFTLCLSFMGWFALCLFCSCGIAFLWLLPYMFSSFANFYENLRVAYGLPMNTGHNFNNYNNKYNQNHNYNNMNSNHNYDPSRSLNNPNYHNNPANENSSLSKNNQDYNIDKF